LGLHGGTPHYVSSVLAVFFVNKPSNSKMYEKVGTSLYWASTVETTLFLITLTTDIIANFTFKGTSASDC